MGDPDTSLFVQNWKIAPMISPLSHHLWSLFRLHFVSGPYHCSGAQARLELTDNPSSTSCVAGIKSPSSVTGTAWMTTRF